MLYVRLVAYLKMGEDKGGVVIKLKRTDNLQLLQAQNYMCANTQELLCVARIENRQTKKSTTQ